MLFFKHFFLKGAIVTEHKVFLIILLKGSNNDRESVIKSIKKQCISSLVT